ncbi:nicotinate (nicotinamide) nucleotide adenylyltransferase [uncultured Dysgonomonas sp.]|uniref:Probable nicotinate-nucleotide adenylyltransferase n=1 Tax=uncultured Dysgonomonas sp. TaxID=206096 RepID=A0A212JKS0_9BACT|nr:nicotinate (nicotinamide) nucleotide adenylyltransferase [uncultured Dysgonomonas sp.]SBW00043.1 putative nicotinate-nucleotide adenylyltransferase [uncultured Dysgonomonas sp.]
MNIGIFSGSFNPIHIGHLILANYIVEFTEIEEVWFLVSPQNPLKSEDELSDEHIRLEMTELALAKYTKLKASDFEFSMPIPSYTVNTLDALRNEYPGHDFTLIIGADNWNVFESWREYDKILENYKIKVYPRLGHRITIPTKLRDKVEALDSPIIEISSTFIRDSIYEGKDVRAFLPDDIYDYILNKGLYKKRL